MGQPPYHLEAGLHSFTAAGIARHCRHAARPQSSDNAQPRNLPLQEKNGLVMESPGPVLPVKVAKASEPEEEAELRLAAMVCSLENKDECLMCGS